MSLRSRLVSWNAALGLCLCVLSLMPAARAAVYYVAPGGDDKLNNGTITYPWATPQKALDKAVPGDTVLLRGGTYLFNAGSYPMSFSTVHRGSDTSWLTVKNYPGETPIINVTKTGAVWTAIDLANAAYVEINGLTLLGWNSELTLADAKAEGETDGVAATPTYNGSAITIDGRDQVDSLGNLTLTRTAANRPHHLRIIGNTVRGFPGAGISAIQSDYLHIEGNTVEDCSWFTRFANSGISVWQAWNYPDATTADTINYRIKILGNRCFGNKTQVLWVAQNKYSDGNGIIIDDSRNTQNGSLRGAYTGRFLVANNLVVNNGGSGIHSYLSDKVDIVHNTAYYNGQELDWGEIFASESGTVRIYNNICVARPDRAINKQSASSTVDYRNNIYFGGYANAASYTANNTTADPGFLNAATDLATADFNLGPSSPAIDAALTTLIGDTLPLVPTTLPNDITGGTRSRDVGPDIGAYERAGRSLPTTGIVVTGKGEPILTGDTTTSVGNETAFPSTEINLPTGNAPVHTFTVINRDSVERTITSLSVSGSTAFTVSAAPTLPLTLAAGASSTFQVRFLPATTGTNTGTFTLVHSSPAATNPFVFALSGVGVQLPYVGLSAASVSASLPLSATATHSQLVLTNSGSANMTWNADLPRVYAAADSLSPTGPAYQWVDISTSGTPVTFSNLNDSFSASITPGAGFSFPFFGTGYTSLCINTNGHITFDTTKASVTGNYNTPRTLATMGTRNNSLSVRSIAAFFDDLLLISGVSQVRYRLVDANTLVVSWLDVTYNTDAGKAGNLQRKLSFQLILKRDGTITAQYQGVANTDGNYLVGIVNTMPRGTPTDTSQFLQYAYSANALNPGLAVRFTPPSRINVNNVNFAPGGSTRSWANFTGTTSGTLAPGASQSLPLAFNATNLVSGLTYLANLTISTNAPGQTSLIVPISLTVGAVGSTANQSPAVSITSPSRPTTFNGIGTQVTLTANATDTGGSVARVEFFDGTTLIATATTSPYSCVWSPATAGLRTLTARATDNLGSTTLSLGVAATVVNLPPVVSVTAPTSTSPVTLGVPFTLTANAADGDAGSITKVEFYVNGLLTRTATTATSAATYTAAWTPPILGPATFYAKAYDANGASTVSSSVTFSVVRPNLPTSGLLAYWRFNETSGLTTAADLSGNSRSATLADANTTWTSAGKFAGALAFNGANNAKVSFAHGAITTAFSLSAWVKADVTPTGTLFPRIISLQGGPSLFLVRNFSTDENFTGGLGFNDGTNGDWRSSSSLTNTTPITITASAWQHVVITFDLSRNDTAPVFYLNGALLGTVPGSTMNRNGSIPVVNATTSTALSLLGNRLDLLRPLTGALDQVRLYNRVLTAAEVTALYLDDGGPLAPASLNATPSTTGIVLGWSAITSTNATVTYQVARSLTANGPFTPLASGLSATGFNDTTTAAGTTYYYTVSATAAGDSGPAVTSAAATAWTALQIWRNATFGTIAATGNAADLADPDGDGIGNLMEYALGLSPTTPNATGLPNVTLGADGYLSLTFFRARADLTYTIQASSDLTTWTDVATNPGAINLNVMTKDLKPSSPRRFMRLKVTTPSP